MSLPFLVGLSAFQAPAAPTPPVVWIRVERPSFDLWGVIVSSLEFVLLAIALALLLGAVLGWLLIRRSRPGVAPPRPALDLRPRPLPGTDARLGPGIS